MSKLRTLKDIEKDSGYFENENMMTEPLRSAAKEWIKHNQQISDGIPSGYNVTTYRDINKWITHFFNLDDEE